MAFVFETSTENFENYINVDVEFEDWMFLAKKMNILKLIFKNTNLKMKCTTHPQAEVYW